MLLVCVRVVDVAAVGDVEVVDTFECGVDERVGGSGCGGEAEAARLIGRLFILGGGCQ